jgi:hypothetical protein
MLLILSVHINVRFLSDNFSHRILQSQFLPPILGRAFQQPQQFYHFCYSQTCGPHEWPDISPVPIIWVSSVRFICQGSLQGAVKLALEQHNILSLWTLLAGQESVNEKVFLFIVIFGFTAVWTTCLFFWITEQRHIRKERILCMLIFVLFVCLLITTCGGKKRKLNFC